MSGIVSTTELSFTWVSDSNGNADGTSLVDFDGQILGLITIPAAGADGPNDNYDVRVLDQQGNDVLLGAGLARDMATTEHVGKASLGSVMASKLTLRVTKAGSGKRGVVVLRFR